MIELDYTPRTGEQKFSLLRMREVDSYSADWMYECEVRTVARMKEEVARAQYLARVRGRRGDEASKKLREDVLILRAMRAIWGMTAEAVNAQRARLEKEYGVAFADIAIRKVRFIRANGVAL